VEQEFVEIGMEVMALMDVVINVVVKILYLSIHGCMDIARSVSVVIVMAMEECLKRITKNI